MHQKTQRQIVLQEPGRLAVVEGVVPELEPGTALVRVRRIGVCGTDIHAFHGRQPFFEYPRILGHELGGEVLAVDGGGGPKKIKVGDRCAVSPYLNDNDSPASRRGRSNCCEQLQVIGVHCDGGMRPVIRVPLDKIYPSATLDCECLALVEMLGIGAHAVARAGLVPAVSGGGVNPGGGEYVAVIGAGPIGMSVVQFLQAAGVGRVVVVDRVAHRLDFCRRAFGVEHTIHVDGDSDVAALLRESGGGELPNVLFDVTGNPGSMMGSFESAAHGGRIVFVGLFQGLVTFDDANFHRRELTLMSSRNATPDDWRSVISGLEDGSIATGPWITHRMVLEEVPKRFAKIVSDLTLRKAMIEVGD